MSSLKFSADFGHLPLPTAEQRANLRANITRLARDPEDAALLIDMLDDDRGDVA